MRRVLRGRSGEVMVEEGGRFAFYYKTNDAKIKTHGVAGRVSKERNEAATGSDGTRPSRWIRIYFSQRKESVGLGSFRWFANSRINPDCRGCHSNEPISGNPWSINSCDKDWRRGPCSTGVCPVFQLPSSLQLSGSSFKLRLQLQTCIESGFVAWSADFSWLFLMQP